MMDWLQELSAALQGPEMILPKLVLLAGVCVLFGQNWLFKEIRGL